jgi:hypothetical protein
VTQLRQGLGLDLADALAGEVEPPAHLVEGQRLVVGQAEPQRQDLALALVQVPEQLVEVLPLDDRRRQVERRGRRRVGQQVAELVVAVVADGGRQGDEVGGGAQRGLHLVDGDAGLVGQLPCRRLAAQRLEHRGRAAGQRGQGVHEVGGEADRAALVGDAPADRLADPPRGVGRELEPLAVVELLDGPHEAEVAFLDEVEQRHAGGLVALGDRDDQPQVRLDELVAGLVGGADGTLQLAAVALVEHVAPLDTAVGDTAGGDGPSEAGLVLGGEEGIVTQLGEVAPGEVDGALGGRPRPCDHQCPSRGPWCLSHLDVERSRFTTLRDG